MNAPSVERVLGLQRPAMEVMVDISGKLCEGFVAVNEEWTSFVNHRLKEDMTVPQRLAACATWQDVMRVYATYSQNAYAHFQSEFEQLTKLNQRTLQNTMTVVRSHMAGTAQGKS